MFYDLDKYSRGLDSQCLVIRGYVRKLYVVVCYIDKCDWIYIQKLSLLAHFVFQEISFWNIESIVVLLCYIVAMPDLLYK